VRRAFGLTEVLVAFMVLAVAFLPLFTVLTTSRDEASDASEFLALLDALDERAAADLTATAVVVERGARSLSLRTSRVDGLSAVAPRRGGAR
jgi:type II secretory pathway pseudopilin PulG